jgi:protein-L-isoaspartate(D-aspartate) O-methyltransferase
MDKATLIERIGRRVHDPRVLAALAAVPRELFVPERLRDDAWRDIALPIGEGQTISQPFVVARMCELLELRGDETVLDVGTGSGYHAAVLAQLARRVVSIERHASLTHQARAALGAAGVANVTLVTGDGAKGHPPEAPYDAINVAASAHGVPAALAGQLTDGGRMVIPSDAHGQRLVVVRRRNGELRAEQHEFVRFVPLVSDADVGPSRRAR